MIRAAIDWGSSRFRAYRLNDAFDIVDSRDSATGIKYVVEKLALIKKVSIEKVMKETTNNFFKIFNLNSDEN